MKAPFPWEKIDPLIEDTLSEDLGNAGDLTTDCIIPKGLIGRGEFIVQEEGIVAGIPVVQRVFSNVDKKLSCSFCKEDGMKVYPNVVIGYVDGKLRSILRGERTALNFLQRLSGIATLTARFVNAIQDTGVKVLDTRKTTPQLRFLEKYAVRQGGGENHRFGLYDMVLIKDNHIDSSGGITPAVKQCLHCLQKMNKDVRIEVETRTLEEVREALKLPVHRIMLDNMDVETMQNAVIEVGGMKEIEASGNISLEKIRAVAETGVDFISVGALTHSARALNISLRIVSD